MKRLVLIDGHAVIHRAYHAYPPLTTSSGQPSQAAYGFVAILLRVINELHPSHLIVCFDLPVATFRHEAYIAYQAHRPTADQDLIDQIEMVREIVEISGIPVYTAAGFEADDVIGTLAAQAVHNKVDEVVIVTGDRDIMQLVNDRVKVYAPINGMANARLLGEAEVKEYIGVAPDKIVDYKALAGDSSDNYPGVVGIGPKTAQNLLEKFGSLEEIYRRLEEGKGKMEGVAGSIAQKLVAGKDSAFLSQHLARIAIHAPVSLDLEKAQIKPLRENKEFMEKLKEFGFKSLIGRIDGATPKNEGKEDGQMELL